MKGTEAEDCINRFPRERFKRGHSFLPQASSAIALPVPQHPRIPPPAGTAVASRDPLISSAAHARHEERFLLHLGGDQPLHEPGLERGTAGFGPEVPNLTWILLQVEKLPFLTPPIDRELAALGHEGMQVNGRRLVAVLAEAEA